LINIAGTGDIEAFAKEFVPLDLPQPEINEFVTQMKASPEQWVELVEEIKVCATGVSKIEGDEETSTVFYFTHPQQPLCDREVEFTCVEGQWRANA